LERALKD
jgi:hypothetical protein